MKVLHVPFCFRPDPIGGTEVYVEGLARAQQERGIDVCVAAPGTHSAQHTDAGLRVWRFAVSTSVGLGALYGEGDPLAARELEKVVDHERPDVVHLHSYTRAVSAPLAKNLHRQGVQLVFTYHTPTVSCARGTLMRWGSEVCDGTLDVRRCASCTLQGLGLDRTAGALVGALPTVVGQAVGALGLEGGTWTALRMSQLIARQHAALREFVWEMDRVIALSNWTRELLLRIGVPDEKVALSRHGLALSSPQPLSQRERGHLRVACFGRVHPTKGVDILVRAVRADPMLPVDVHVFGTGEPAYMDTLRELAAGDPRITFFAPVPSSEVAPRLREYDILAVPSRWLETGPLVILEASAAGVPVLGSNLGGIAELVTHEQNGLLIEPESVDAWREALGRVTGEPSLLARLRAGVRPPRGMDDVADDMLRLYTDILHQPAQWQ